MAEISSAALLARVQELLKGANLETMTAKKVRKELETQFGTDLQDRKKEINKMIEDIINAESSGSDDDKAKPQNGRRDSSGSESDIVDRDTGSKKAKPTKKRRDSSAASDSDNDAELARKLQAEEESKTKRSTRSNGSSSSSQKPKKKKKKRKADSDDSDGDAPAKKKATGGYLKPLPLSYELSEFTGEKELPRHAVVKRIWAYCKENNLMDPKNKQFAICDTELFKVIGVKRFRLFGMMKLLTKHFEKA